MRRRRGDPVQEVADWNRSRPPGTKVLWYQVTNPNRGPGVPTKTRSEAWVIGDHSAIVKVEGVAGGVPLSSLVVISEAKL